MKISAVVVTRGDIDISVVKKSLAHFDELIVWDNSKTPKDLKVFGRFAGAYIARNDLIYVQDDDCLIRSEHLVEAYVQLTNPNAPVLVNFPVDRRRDYQGTDIALIGWGTIFRKLHLQVFERYLRVHPFDELFLRECDRVFSYLNRNNLRTTDLGVTHLSYAFGEDRMGREPQHAADLHYIRRALFHVDNFLRRESI